MGGQSQASGLCLIGDRAWVVRRSETEGGVYGCIIALVHRPERQPQGDKVKRRRGSLSKAEPKYESEERPVRKRIGFFQPTPRAFQAWRQKLEGVDGTTQGSSSLPRRHVAFLPLPSPTQNSTADPRTTRFDSVSLHTPSRARRMMPSLY